MDIGSERACSENGIIGVLDSERIGMHGELSLGAKNDKARKKPQEVQHTSTSEVDKPGHNPRTTRPAMLVMFSSRVRMGRSKIYLTKSDSATHRPNDN